LVEEVFDEFGIRYDDGLPCEDVSDNYVVLGPFSLENVKIALILSEILLNVVTHEAQRKQLDFVPQTLSISCKCLHPFQR
jgi:hypothetical protein